MTDLDDWASSSNDPLGGRPIDEPRLRWLLSRARARRRQRREIGPDLEGMRVRPVGAPDAPTPRPRARERSTAWWHRMLPFPEQNVYNYLGGGEQVLHAASPAKLYFIVGRWKFVLGVIAALVLAGFLFSRGESPVGGVILVAAVVTAIVLFLQGLYARYTAYVITNVRMMRMTGVVRNQIESIPWARVTDLGFEQNVLQRMLGYATLHIESANDTMGLKHMYGVPDPTTFNNYLMDMVVAKQGATAPLGRRSEYRMLPSDRNVWGLRERRRGLRRERPPDFTGAPDEPPKPAPPRDDKGDKDGGDKAEAGDTADAASESRSEAAKEA